MTSREARVLPPSRRQALLATAAAEFVEHGYQRASLNRVIAAQSMSKSSFYHYFESKAELFDAVVSEAAARLTDTVPIPDAARLAGDDFWAQVTGFVTGMVRAGRAGPVVDLARLFYLPDVPQGSAVTRIRGAIDDWIAAALMTGRVRGAVRDDLPATLQVRMVVALLWAVDEWSVDQLPTLGPVERDRLASAQVAALRRLLEPLPVGWALPYRTRRVSTWLTWRPVSAHCFRPRRVSDFSCRGGGGLGRRPRGRFPVYCVGRGRRHGRPT